MTTELTYTERADLADKRADRERINRINDRYKGFQAAGKSVGSNLIDAVNLAREIGLELQGISGTEQVSFSFFTTHCAKDLPFDYETVRQFIAITRKIKEPVKTVEEAVPVLQHVCLAQGLLKLPEHRDGPQQSHDTQPVVFVFHTLGTAWERIENRIKDPASLDDETRNGVRDELDRHIKKLTEWRGRL